MVFFFCNNTSIKYSFSLYLNSWQKVSFFKPHALNLGKFIPSQYYQHCIIILKVASMFNFKHPLGKADHRWVCKVDKFSDGWDRRPNSILRSVLASSTMQCRLLIGTCWNRISHLASQVHLRMMDVAAIIFNFS